MIKNKVAMFMIVGFVSFLFGSLVFSSLLLPVKAADIFQPVTIVSILVTWTILVSIMLSVKSKTLALCR